MMVGRELFHLRLPRVLRLKSHHGHVLHISLEHRAHGIGMSLCLLCRHAGIGKGRIFLHLFLYEDIQTCAIDLSHDVGIDLIDLVVTQSAHHGILHQPVVVFHILITGNDISGQLVLGNGFFHRPQSLTHIVLGY